uniref:Uncharacterized protein n=1 Tax=Oryza meridionalis TaxID=40149 RepID=A0A0E0DN50_9ORYZ
MAAVSAAMERLSGGWNAARTALATASAAESRTAAVGEVVEEAVSSAAVMASDGRRAQWAR